MTGNKNWCLCPVSKDLKLFSSGSLNYYSRKTVFSQSQTSLLSVLCDLNYASSVLGVSLILGSLTFSSRGKIVKVEAACPSIRENKCRTDEQRNLEEVLEDPRSLTISWERNRGHKSIAPGIYLIFHLPNTVKLGKILRQAHQQRGSNWNVKLKFQDWNPEWKEMLFSMPPAAWLRSWGERSLM